MTIVLVLDQRNSSTTNDRVTSVSAVLNRRYTRQFTLPFVRTAGDEMQAVLRAPTALGSLLGAVVDDGGWWIGVGLGEVTKLGESSRESAGSAFKAARLAIDAAKHDQGSPGPVAVRGEPEPIAAWLQAALGALAFIIESRTHRQREVLAVVRECGSHQMAARRLGVTQQAVSKVVASAGFIQEEQLTLMMNGLATEASD